MNHTKADGWQINGTHLQGYIVATLDQIEDTFGEPVLGDGYKTTTEWSIEFEDGTIATIYDWKRDSAPTYGQTIEWNVGGFTHDAVLRVRDALTLAQANHRLFA